MSSLTLEYTTQAQDTYLRAVQARTVVLEQLNDVRRDPRVLARAEVSEAQVSAAFETIWRVASFYESNLWVDANEERQNNKLVEAELMAARHPAAPVPADQIVGERP